MNTTKYMQTDSRWSQLPFRNLPDNIGNNGCGEVSIVNMIIEMSQYAKYTPATIQPYCKQFATPKGILWSGVPVMMKHYGLTDVKECPTMQPLWNEMAKGDRVAFLIMNDTPAGSKNVHWTSSGHCIAVTGYRYKDNDHQVYVKDSYSNSKSRNGWLGYKTYLRGAVVKIWVGKLSGKPAPTPKPVPVSKLKVDGIGGEKTVKRLQEFLKCDSKDGIISGQNKNLAPYYPSFKSVQYGRGGSNCIWKLQEWLNLSDPDGIMGKNTTTALQKRLKKLGYYNSKCTGIFGVSSMKALQEMLNNNGKKKSDGAPTPDPKPEKKIYKVVDVSEFQTNINWEKAKADGVEGVIVRCGFRGATSNVLQEDAMFLKHIKGAYKAGLPVGIYMFTEAVNEKEGKEEADYAIKMWKKAGVPISFPIAVDTEEVSIKGERARNLTKAQRTKAIKGFCERIKEKGYTPMIYASTSWLNSKLDMKKLPYDVWVAQYYDVCEYEGKYVMWQYTSRGKVAGAKGNIDLNKCYIAPKKVNPPK